MADVTTGAAGVQEGEELRPLTHIVWLVAALLAAFLLWAYLGILDEVATGQGKVVPSQQEQVIQSLEGGILRELYVRADDIVERGQILARLHPTGTESDVQETEAQLLAKRAQVARLSAEVGGGDLVFPEELFSHPELVRSETALFEARRDSYEKSIELIRQSRELLEEELGATDRLSSVGASSRMDVVRLKRQIVDLNLKEDEMRHDYLVKAREELAKVRTDVEALGAELRGRQDRLARMTLRSPVRGIVKDVAVTTVGGVVPPNGNLMTIVPLDDQLLVEARIMPRDIAFIHPGLSATVKVTAYDSAIYGSLEGTVVSVSPDSLRDEVDPEIQYYRVYVRSDRFELKNKAGKTFPITTGMVTTVDIHTGSKTVLQYLLKPLNRAGEALRER